MTPGNNIALLASTLACKNRRLDKSAMTTPEKKTKKKRPTVPKHRWTPLSRRLMHRRWRTVKIGY
jgi:hypothetical protein